MIGCAFRLLGGLKGPQMLPAPDLVEPLDAELLVGAEVVTDNQVARAGSAGEHNGEPPLCGALAEAMGRGPVP